MLDIRREKGEVSKFKQLCDMGKRKGARFAGKKINLVLDMVHLSKMKIKRQ